MARRSQMLKACNVSTLFTSFVAVLVLAGCIKQSRPAVDEVMSREARFADYPRAGWTYLSFSKAHGFQVNYIGSNGQAWLWYPGNSTVVPEEWKRDVVAGQKAVCWRHPSKSYNPVTKQLGGSFACQSLALSQRSIIARRKGDPYRLSSGSIPYRLQKCKAPQEFVFDRTRFWC